MTPSAEYKDYVLEFLEYLISVRISRFFGGIGISYDAVQFAMIMGNSLYFVVDENTRKKYEHAGMQPFSYMTQRGRIQVRKYFELPEDVLNDPEQLRLWANEAIQVAAKTKKSKRSSQKSDTP